MNTPLIVLLVLNYWYSIHFTYFYCSYKNNRIKYLGTSSKNLIKGAVSLTSTKDLQEILLRENITYLLNTQPKFHNIQRSSRCLGSSIITTNRQTLRLWQKNVSAGLDWIVSYRLDQETLAFMRWLVTGWVGRMGRMGRMDWMGVSVGRRWDGLTLALARTGAPPWAPEQECHHWLLRGGGI